MVEKAYAKLRYCYKGILSIGIQQLIFEFTGITCQKIVIENEKDEEMVMEELYEKYLKVEGKMVIGVGEGVTDKRIKVEGV